MALKRVRWADKQMIDLDSLLAMTQLPSEYITAIVSNLFTANFFIMSGLTASVNGTNDDFVDVAAGVALQDGQFVILDVAIKAHILSGVDGIDGFGNGLGADPTNPRYSVIGIKRVETPTDSANKTFVNDTVAPATFSLQNTATRFAISDFQISIVHGDPSPSPLVPNNISGFQTICEVFVPAGAIGLISGNLTDTTGDSNKIAPAWPAFIRHVDYTTLFQYVREVLPTQDLTTFRATADPGNVGSETTLPVTLKEEFEKIRFVMREIKRFFVPGLNQWYEKIASIFSAATPPVITAGAGSAGSATTPAHSDHSHQHPGGLGVNLHHSQAHSTTHAETTGRGTDDHHPIDHNADEHDDGLLADMSAIGGTGSNSLTIDGNKKGVARFNHRHAHPTGLGGEHHSDALDHDQAHAAAHATSGGDQLTHQSLPGRGTGDHHAKSHVHLADGSGEVAHSSTTGRGADDHHDEAHTTTHVSTTGRTPNDHHNEAHTTTHASTTGRTPNDHHNEAHTTTHASTTGRTPNDHHQQSHSLDSHSGSINVNQLRNTKIVLLSDMQLLSHSGAYVTVASGIIDPASPVQLKAHYRLGRATFESSSRVRVLINGVAQLEVISIDPASNALTNFSISVSYTIAGVATVELQLLSTGGGSIAFLQGFTLELTSG